MRINCKFGMSAALLLLLAGSTYADPVTFFGEDLNGDPNAVLASHPNSDTARNAFFSNLVGVGTETFEGFASGSMPPLAINFAGAGTATITDSGQGGIDVENWGGLTNGFGRYAISGQQYLEVDSGGFAINFDNPSGIAAFGFYGTDIGDFGGALSLVLTKMDNTTVTLNVGNLLGSGTNSAEDGSALYFGFYDTAQSYKSIAFNNTQGGIDAFGFDDFSVGSLAQVQVSTPEPTSLIGMSGLVLLGLVGLRRRRVS